MLQRIKAVPLTVLMLFVSLCAHAQDEPEYKAEIGVGGALVAYQGDFNGSLTKNMQPMGALVAKYRPNPRSAWALNIGFGKQKGSSENTATWYPATSDTTITFNNSLVDVGLRYEYNFWPYGTGREYRGAKPLVPFVAIGLGAGFVKTDEKNIVATNMPIGFGVKYKMAERVNLTLEWMMHFTLSDELDGVKDPYGIKSNGLFKNTDCFSTLQLSITYDIFAKCKTCNSDLY
ncbi:MAG: outer membrane beta-barrel protein [Prevotella sp.]|nr:outer membrane beta-barrel protein [Prevotella sp.]